MDARLKRREARLDEKFVRAFLFVLAGSLFEGCILQPVAEGLVRGNAEADDKRDDETSGQRILDLGPKETWRVDAGKLKEKRASKATARSGSGKHARVDDKDKSGKALGITKPDPVEGERGREANEHGIKKG
jgi:hypothetical protein